MPLKNLLTLIYFIFASSEFSFLELPGYNLVRADNITNTERGGI